MDGDFELEIGSGQGGYTVRVIRAPAGGETSGTFQLDVKAVLNRLNELEATVLASTVPARRIIPHGEKPLHEVGTYLFQSLFTGEVSDTYRASLGAAQHSGMQLRVVLRLAAPEVAALPWEMLFDPRTRSYLCQEMPLLRHIPASDYNPRPLELKPPLRILGIVAAPHNLPGLDADAEKQYLAQALERPIVDGLVELVWAPRATWDGIQTELLDGPWHVLHFIGHGDYDMSRKEGWIALESDTGRSAMVESSRLMHLLREAEPTPRLVVLNSCSSGEAGREDLFSGTAAALVGGGINAVVAMQFTVSDRAAIAFARGFYNAIAHGRDVDKAASSGRRSILGLNTLEWVTPVLYVRGGFTRLFTLTGSPVPPEPAVVPPPPVLPKRRPLALLRALYLQAGAELSTKNYGPAIELLDELLAMEPGYPDAAELRKTAQDRRGRAETYRAAREAEDAGDWEKAVHGYRIVSGDPDFPDAAARREACAARQRVTDLQDELRLYARAGAWQTVLDLASELAALNAAAANPDGLATHAQLEILYTQARQAEESGDLDLAMHAYGQILTTDPDFRDAALRHDTCGSTAGKSIKQDRPVDPIQFRASEYQSAASGTGSVSGTEVRQVHPNSRVSPVALSPDWTRLATGSDGKTARIWDTTTGRPILSVKHGGLLSAVLAVAFSPDGTRLATGSDDMTARIWDITTGKELMVVRHDDWVSTVAFSPDGTRLATGSDDMTARIWDTTTGKELIRVRHYGCIHAVAFNPNGTRLATGSDDKTARIWDTTTGKGLMQVRLDDWVCAVAFTPDGTRLAAVSADKTAGIWDITTGKELVQVRHERVRAVAFSPDGTRLATGSADKTARIWDTTSGKELMQVRHYGGIHAMAFSPDGIRLAGGSNDNTAQTWTV